MKSLINKKQKSALFLITIISAVSFLTLVNIEASNGARPVLLSPRIGNSLRGPRSAGNLNDTDYLDDTIRVWISTDPSDIGIPSQWLSIKDWIVAISPSVLDNAPLIPLKIIGINKGQNPNVLFGLSMDVNNLYPSAIYLDCKVPGNISPVLYDLYVGYSQNITNLKNQVIQPGSWQGESNLQKFMLTEANCIYFPWEFDAHSSSSLEDSQYQVNPFTVLHVTDTHYSSNLEYILPENKLWQDDSSVIAPDLIMITGDLMDQPYDLVEEYDIAYREIKSINLPLVLMSGNHDQYNLGPWRHYFGPLYSAITLDDLSIISFDTTMPLGTGVLNWIEQKALTHRKSSNAGAEAPIFLACHYPLMGSYFTSGWPAVSEMMQRLDIDGIFSGHTHSDFNAELSTLDSYIYEYMMGSDKTQEEQFETVQLDYNAPLERPQMVVTRSAAKSSGITLFEDLFSNIPSYSGYRKLNFIENQVVNYTYDFDGDGDRDPFLSIPNGRYTVNMKYDGNFGDPNTGVEWILSSNSTEYLPAARAIFQVPLPEAGYEWDLSELNKTNGAYIRTSVRNGTHCWIDARVASPPETSVSLYLTQKMEEL